MNVSIAVKAAFLTVLMNGLDVRRLSVREARLHLALTSEASQKYLTLIQMSYNLGPTYLDLLMDRLVSTAIAPLKPADTS